MLAIVMEGVLFVALVAACGALLYFVVLSSPLGRRWREDRNRREIEAAAALHCPVHGQLTDEVMVRLPSGDRVCPHCFKETVWQTR